MNWKKKLLLDAVVYMFAATIFSLGLKSILGEWDWRGILDCAAWPWMLFAYGPPYSDWWFNSWLWLALAAGLLYLFAHQFWQPGLRPALLAAAAVAFWWLAALFILWAYVTSCC